ncbi:MAG: helix-turn-helix domain-containing protein [Ruminococcaceae bacterium]|nr:helix-turn-helix domain-containing protein [Oscillospiraceae bacterium]
MELGKKIKQFRFKAGLTQEQLAEKLDISPQSVSKWENAVAMPDITALPLLAEIFGISIDDLFDLTAEQRLNRIENRMEFEDELPQDVFIEYEEFLKQQLNDGKNKKRATELLAYLYWHRMDTFAKKSARYAKESIRRNPDEKECQWLLQKAEGHFAWDWNISNHTSAIDFYKEIIKENPESRLSYCYLLDNLIADRRTDEAEQALEKMSALKDTRPVINQVYRAYIALARFDEKTADGIIENLTKENRDDSVCLFEAAQYYAGKCDYEKAIDYYELAFEREPRKPRFTDELMGIADIYQITGNYSKAAETYGRMIDLLENEWGMTEETALKEAKDKKAFLLSKVK